MPERWKVMDELFKASLLVTIRDFVMDYCGPIVLVLSGCVMAWVVWRRKSNER